MNDAGGGKARVLVGVDGGGTNTDCVVIDASTGEVVGQAVGGASNWNSTGKDAALRSLRGSIIGALAAAGLETDAVAGICAGMSGVDRPEDVDAVREYLLSWLPPGAEVLVYNDSVIALACGTGGSLLGCVLIIGTGTIALCVGPDGSHVRASGWGPAFLDGGSGYDIGQRALAAVARATDGRGPATDLVDAVCSFCGVADPADLLGWAYGEPGWARIAGLAPAVLACAEGGNSVAFRIVTAAADEAVSAAVAAAGRARLRGQRFTLVLSGGLLSEDSPFLDVVREGLKLALPGAELTHPRVEPALGAALLVRQRLFGPPNDVSGGGFGNAQLPRDPFGSPSLLRSPLRTPDALHRPRHHRRTPSSLGKQQSMPPERRAGARGHRRAVSSLDPVFGSAPEAASPLLRKAGSAQVARPGQAAADGLTLQGLHISPARDRDGGGGNGKPAAQAHAPREHEA